MILFHVIQASTYLHQPVQAKLLANVLELLTSVACLEEAIPLQRRIPVYTHPARAPAVCLIPGDRRRRLWSGLELTDLTRLGTSAGDTPASLTTYTGHPPPPPRRRPRPRPPPAPPVCSGSFRARRRPMTATHTRVFRGVSSASLAVSPLCLPCVSPVSERLSRGPARLAPAASPLQSDTGGRALIVPLYHRT